MVRILKNIVSKKVLLSDIRFWIFLFFIIRLFGITNPPLEIAHSWRQTTVTMVARNFLENDNNIFFPRIDIAGNESGITGMEFPLLNYLIYITSVIFGYQHWYGRLINLVISSLGLFFFYKLVRKYFNEKTAFFSAMVLTCSIWFAYSRKIMPDTFSMSLVIAGIYYGICYLDRKSEPYSFLHLLLFVFLISLGTLSKLPSAYLIILLILPVLNINVSLIRKAIFIVALGLSILPAAIWYFYWVPHLIEVFKFSHFFMGKKLTAGALEIYNNMPLTLSKFYEDALKYIGFIIFSFGLLHAVINKNKTLLLIFIFSFGAFIIIILKSGYTFSHHSYYIIPFVPVMALITGYGLDKMKKNLAVFILFAICIEGILNQQHDFRIHGKEHALLKLESDMNRFSDRNDLIMINSGEYPTPMYFAHRKGWIESNEKINDFSYLETLKNKGLKYVVILKNTFGTDMEINRPIVIENEDYRVYTLTDNTRSH